ncbi:MBL fold metallo-hydrolase [Amycolatopsis jejuensis]|uniref:MBL fold metallo-hydrolase n=1 Tax=Amycolatopsis jejuensis TaxID=330084 RepID=UPI000524AFD5|nr:MBL fold metallo-hydrolase [Amycolatopsis jejuensis]
MDWYSVTEVGDGLSLISEPQVHPFLQANIWHLRGQERDVLIDSGLGVAPLAPVVRQLSAREPTVVLTHAHLDHMGGAHEFTERWAHPLEPVGSPLPGSLESAVLAETLGLSAIPLPPLLISATPSPDYDPHAYQLHPAPATHHLHDGDVLDLGGRTLEVLHLPGHTPGSIALYDPKSKSLFSGDVIYDLDEDDQLLDDIHGADIPEYCHTMRRLADLPVEVVYPGHGPTFGQSRLRELIKDYLSRRDSSPVDG